MSTIITYLLFAAVTAPVASRGEPLSATFDPIAVFLIGGSVLMLAALVYGILSSGPEDVLEEDKIDPLDQIVVDPPAHDAPADDSARQSIT